MSRRDVGEWKRRRELLSEQERSGQSQASFCRERGIALWQFYSWRKRLRVIDTQRPSGVANESTDTSAGFVEVRVMPSEPLSPELAESTLIEIRLCKGRSLLVGAGFDALHLQRLVAALETA